MATQQFYVIVDLTGGVGGTLLYFIFPGPCCDNKFAGLLTLIVNAYIYLQCIYCSGILAIVMLNRKNKNAEIEEQLESQVRFLFFSESTIYLDIIT